ncbi:hypothetical protein [Sorangium sp. So ce362]|uniref:hypothetical protein n=1 Tax=Sorangium sp. So ce362 TaxID=3133303 RepID=UPI003F6134BC
MLTGGPAEIRCDVCGAELATTQARGFVRWWERRPAELPSGAVVAFDVLCAGPCSARRSAERWRELGGPGAVVALRDMPLDWIAGRRAIVQLARLVRTYDWTERHALERCLDTFVQASRLPDGAGPP